MADFLIKHLEKKANEYPSLKILLNQWEFDEKLIPKALQTVGNLFPHYSRHDESHSKQILVNIECLLGTENIEKLTAIDTWLLLEAAYWHDIGMIVPHKDIQETFEQADFQQYIKQIRNNPHHDLHRFSTSFDCNNMSQCFAGADSPLDAMDKFRQLMAEWFRQKHPARAGKIIEDPWQSCGISSPRTELIPARLFKLLGRICFMHGSPFKDLLAPPGLSHSEKGLLAEDECHPRFIACLLRLGDLLDLDDNRFCPVMQRIAGDNRPALSKAHEEKHAGIRHFTLNPDRIEITAECKTVDGYLEAFKWFDWLEQEMQDQMSRWHDIVPDRTFGSLPTLKKREVQLIGGQKFLNEGQRPQFSLDTKQTIKLLSENMYSDEYICIRELLQNAIDATLLKLWLVNKKTAETWENPQAAKSILDKGTIEVVLEEKSPDNNTPPDKSLWLLTIIDQGTGISRDDLSYMLRIGGSQANLFRQDKIDQMPEWMKPSGAFGIGFQSVFLISDKVKLTSKSIFSNEVLEIEMYSPLGNKEGLVNLTIGENDISWRCGTKIEVPILFEKSPKSWRISFRKSISSQILESFDPVLDESFPIEAGYMADKIRTFAKGAILPINGQLKTRVKTFKLSLNEHDFESAPFIEIGGHQLTMAIQPSLAATYSAYNITSY